MKVAIIGDLHLGVKKSDLKFQESQLRFFEKQMVPELTKKGINTIFVAGDVFDTRQTVNVQTENAVLKLFQNTFKDFDVHIIVGNHDMYHTNSTEVNSLKSLNLLDNVTVYEKITQVSFGDKSVMFIPWITDYTKFDNECKMYSADYAIAHMDIIGFMMDKVNMCSSGLSMKTLVQSFDHVYTGHFHSRSVKKIGDKDITYVGSPYQMTRMDMNDKRGYTILDLDTNETKFVENKQSAKFVKIIYPEIPEEKVVKGNIIDIEIKYEDSDKTKLVHEYVEKINALKPGFPINTKVLSSNEEIEIEEDIEDVNLFSLFQSYIEQTKKPNKDELYKELTSLYNSFKGE